MSLSFQPWSLTTREAEQPVFYMVLTKELHTTLHQVNQFGPESNQFRVKADESGVFGLRDLNLAPPRGWVSPCDWRLHRHRFTFSSMLLTGFSVDGEAPADGEASAVQASSPLWRSLRSPGSPFHKDLCKGDQACDCQELYFFLRGGEGGTGCKKS